MSVQTKLDKRLSSLTFMQNIDSEHSGLLAFLLSVGLGVGRVTVDSSQQQLNKLTICVSHRGPSAVGRRYCRSAVGPVETAAEPSLPGGAVWGCMSGVATRDDVEQKDIKMLSYHR